MDSRDPTQITALLVRAARGDALAVEDLLPTLYDELRVLAGQRFRRQSPAHTLQPTALVHEAFIKLTGGCEIDWESRAHFLAVASMAMRQILSNHAASRRALKRGGGRARVTLAGLGSPQRPEDEVDLIDLHDALAKLAEVSPRQARIVEMRFLAGVEEEQIAVALGISASTVRRQWRMARAFLRSEMSGDGPS